MNEKSHSRDHKTEDHGEGVQPEGHFQAETALMPDGEYPLIQRLDEKPLLRLLNPKEGEKSGHRNQK
jgi:hypothetical protein